MFECSIWYAAGKQFEIPANYLSFVCALRIVIGYTTNESTNVVIRGEAQYVEHVTKLQKKPKQIWGCPRTVVVNINPIFRAESMAHACLCRRISVVRLLGP